MWEFSKIAETILACVFLHVLVSIRLIGIDLAQFVSY